MKDALKWLVLGGGAWLAYRNLYGASSSPPAPTTGNGIQPAPTPSGAGGGAATTNNTSGATTGQQPAAAAGPVRTALQNVAGPLHFWQWNHHANQTIDPFTLPRFAGKSIAQVEADRLTLDEYLAVTGLSGLGCAPMGWGLRRVGGCACQG